MWEIQEGSWTTGKLGEGAYAGMTGIKIYAYPTIIFGYYKPATKEFMAAGGGTYQYDGKTLTENLEFFSLQNTPLPATFTYKVQTDGKTTYRQESADGVTKETWKRISNQ